jgi:adenine phosphoribosyltransferase
MSDPTKTFQIDIAGVKRDLPLFEVAPGINIALFNMLGDTEITTVAAQELAKKAQENVEVIVTPEVKSVPLAYELSKLLKIPYIVTRKIRKPYMVGSISVEVTSITTGKPQILWLDGKDLELIKGKKVMLLDDVVSTGSTFIGLRKLMEKAEAEIVSEMVVFTEGDSSKWENVISVGHLPIIKS